ncbi:uncharacterized protein LOC127804899 [Diospyros lotus]|uniref:uncharacterized protein LOC127804899 n=1 Tax=Diospyros lotus TaxID=55363 RepID=UPI00224CD5D8|nr:uncharacterized protein LOC127804899 [Diospyros lotus]
MAEVSTTTITIRVPLQPNSVGDQVSVPTWDDLNPLDHLHPPNISFPPASSSSFIHNFTSSGCSDSDSDSNHFDSEDDEMNFVTDLFGSREEGEFGHESVSDPFLDAMDQGLDFRVFAEAAVFDSVYVPEVGFGSRVSDSTRESDGGLRVVGIDSDSDSEDVVQDVEYEIRDSGTGPPFGDPDIPMFWDCLGFEEQGAGSEELEWEEVDGREGLSSVIDRIEELSVGSEISSHEEIEEAVRNLEWEVLLAVNNLDRAPEFENDGDGGASYLAVRDDYVYAAEYDNFFGQFAENETALKGSPPAAKSVVENLPCVVVTKEELQEHDLACAVCKDEIMEEEKVTKLPCCHHYHGDCIVPWLSIRNTCPVCRYELPTDDLDYEHGRAQRGSLGLPHDLQVLEFIYRVVEDQQHIGV